MTYPEVLANARTCIGQYCKACPVCNGVACKNQIPGPGAKGVGDTAIRNYNRSEERRVGKGVDLGGRRIIKKSVFFKQKTAYEIFA